MAHRPPTYTNGFLLSTSLAPGAAPTRRRLAGMSALRFGAAIWILCFHFAFAGLLDDLGLPTPLLVMLRNGAPMTGFFIMLSGFMMYYAYTRPDGTLSATPRRIWVGRVARLWPIMMVGHLLAVPDGDLLFLRSEAVHAGGLYGAQGTWSGRRSSSFRVLRTET